MNEVTKLVLIVLSIVVPVVILVTWGIISETKKVKKDWETLEYLQKKVDTIKTKDEIIEFHVELVEKGSAINNQFIRLELMKLDWYLLGLYQQFKE